MLGRVESVASLLAVAAGLLLPVAVSAVNIDWITVGNPGNVADTEVMVTDGTTGYGSVGHTYRISKTEVTNAEYAEFLNAKAASDPFGLYNTRMTLRLGGIWRDGNSGSYTYRIFGSKGSRPVNYVSFYDSLRFANWLHNGQGTGDTETGAYTLLGGTAIPGNGLTVTRNAGATIFLPSEDEWYKAAYFDGTSYFAYPAGSDAQPTCASPGAAANTASCGLFLNSLTDVGSYPGSASPYGTFDQGGNVWEWNEAVLHGSFRGLRGGGFHNGLPFLSSSYRGIGDLAGELNYVGFRVASLVPEAGTALLLAAATLCLARRRRRLH